MIIREKLLSKNGGSRELFVVCFDETQSTLYVRNLVLLLLIYHNLYLNEIPQNNLSKLNLINLSVFNDSAQDLIKILICINPNEVTLKTNTSYKCKKKSLKIQELLLEGLNLIPKILGFKQNFDVNSWIWTSNTSSTDKISIDNIIKGDDQSHFNVVINLIYHRYQLELDPYIMHNINTAFNLGNATSGFLELVDNQLKNEFFLGSLGMRETLVVIVSFLKLNALENMSWKIKSNVGIVYAICLKMLQKVQYQLCEPKSSSELDIIPLFNKLPLCFLKLIFHDYTDRFCLNFNWTVVFLHKLMDESCINSLKDQKDTLDRVKLLFICFWNQLIKGPESRMDSESMIKLFVTFKSYANELKEVIEIIPYFEIFQTLVDIFCFDFTDTTKNSIFLIKLVKIKSLIFDDCIYKQLDDKRKINMWGNFKKVIAMKKEFSLERSQQFIHYIYLFVLFVLFVLYYMYRKKFSIHYCLNYILKMLHIFSSFSNIFLFSLFSFIKVPTIYL